MARIKEGKKNRIAHTHRPQMESKGNGQPDEDSELSSQTTVRQQKPTSINIQEANASTVTSLKAPLTPRIDISRASSSSYHEDSSPENVFDQVKPHISHFYFPLF